MENRSTVSGLDFEPIQDKWAAYQLAFGVPDLSGDALSRYRYASRLV